MYARNMNRISLSFLLFSLSALSLHAEYRYRLMLDGKPDSQMTQLSDRALERRQRLGIELDDTDLEVSPLYQQQLTEAGLRIISRSRWLNSVVVMSADGKKINDTFWEDFPFISSVEQVTTTQRANRAPKFRTEEELIQVDGDSDPSMRETYRKPLSEVNALGPLYNAGYRGQGKLIAVLDGGFKNIDRYPWLMDKVIGFRDMYAPEDSVSLFRYETHGACCYSIIGSDADHGVLGSAQEADFYLIKTEANDCEVPLEEDMWVAGAELADSIGADLISSSLGYYEFDSPFESHTHSQFATNEVFICQGATIACQKGILICNAAGNEADNSWKRIIFPADVEEVFTIGGTTPQKEPAYFTSRGFTVPYVKPDVSCRATNCYTVDANSTAGTASSYGAGTSFATPLMCGLCASLWSAVPELTPSELKQVIRESASQYASPDSILGYGMPNFGIALQLANELVGHQQSIAEIKADNNNKINRYDLYGRLEDNKKRKGLYIENGKVIIVR